jgi:hypothetical protein
MVGKQLLGGIAVAASLAAFAVPTAAAAHRAPSFYDNGVTIHDGYAAEVAQAVQASGFAGPAPSSGSRLSFGVADAAVGGFLGAGLMLLLLGPAGVFRSSARGTGRSWHTPRSAGRSAEASSPAP